VIFSVLLLRAKLGRFSIVWVDAAVQIFYSVGAGFGVHLSYASYNTFHNNCLRDCLVTTAVNCFTSFFSGFVIFTYLGFMSYKQGIHISNVATEGPGLVFQVYPEAVATLPGSHFWSMLFFFMLIMLGLDSAMGGMECVITGLMDEFRSFFHGRRFAREIFTLGAATVSFSIALINVTPGGIYLFHLLDTYSAGISLLCSALFEAIAVSWFYGLERFSQDVQSMLGSKPGLYWRICWKFISPIFIIVRCCDVWIALPQQPLKYNDYKYPNWAEWIGWSLALSSILMIPLVALISIMQTPGTLKERIAINISPLEEHESIQQTHVVSRFRCKHWLYNQRLKDFSVIPNELYRVLRNLREKKQHHRRSALSSKIDWDAILYHDLAKLIDTMVSMHSYAVFNFKALMMNVAPSALSASFIVLYSQSVGG
ncbi:hypothetical protein L9F63_008920, partial [Diploptera punctata]